MWSFQSKQVLFYFKYERSFVCIIHFNSVLDKQTPSWSSVLMLCVAAYWPKQMHLTLSHRRSFFFSVKPCLLTHTVAHIYLLAAQVFLFFFFFLFLAAEQLCWSSLGSAIERIKSTRIVAESVLLIQSLQWDFFHPAWGLKPVTFKAHSRLSDPWVPVAFSYIFDKDDTSGGGAFVHIYIL